MKSSRNHYKSGSEDADDQAQIPGANCLIIEQRDDAEEAWEEEVQEEILSDDDVINAIRKWIEFTPYERDRIIHLLCGWEWTKSVLGEVRSCLCFHDGSVLLTHDILNSDLQGFGIGGENLVDVQPLQTIAARTLASPGGNSLVARNHTMEHSGSGLELLCIVLREEQKSRVIAWTLRQLGVDTRAELVLDQLSYRGPFSTATFPQMASDFTASETVWCEDESRAGSLRSQNEIVVDPALTAMQRMARIAPFQWGKYSWGKPRKESQFAQWLHGHRINLPGADSEMNCWEAILMLAHYAKVQIPRGSDQASSESVATALFGLQNAERYNPDGTGWYSHLPVLLEGQIVFFGSELDGDTFHVALALGTQDERGYQEIYSLWTDIGGQTGLSTVEDSVMGQLPRQKKIDWIKIGNLDETYQRAP